VLLKTRQIGTNDPFGGRGPTGSWNRDLSRRTPIHIVKVLAVVAAAERGPLRRRLAGPARLDVDAEVDRNGLVVLDRAECLRLLSTVTLGRIAITSAAMPLILPVNFKLVGDLICLRTTAGTKLDAATAGTVVAFEVDDIDPFSHEGWSVVVVGEAHHLKWTATVGGDALAIPRWAPKGAEESVVVAIEPTIVSGRRIDARVSRREGTT
jgi:nitroimidazol reductase NimA-like FMN-containing flavoprotein (pyridoxamine 5'-phosphate oxidase superfamily)